MNKIRISFDKGAQAYSIYDPYSAWPIRIMGYVGDKLLKSKIFNLLSLGYLHTLIHELGHALSYVVLSGGQATIQLSPNSCYGSTQFYGGKALSAAEHTYVDLSGPLANIIFSVVLIVGIFAITRMVPMSEGLSLGLNIAIGGPSAFWIFGELFYDITSMANRDSGDFGNIANRGWKHLLPSILALLSVLGAGAFGIYLIQWGI